MARHKKRCYNPKDKRYIDYGGRGITVCDEWHDFQTFYKWAIANKYADNLTIERKDNDSGYLSENCIWATTTVQSRNHRTQKNNTSGSKGIHLNKQNNKWQAYIGISGKLIHLGYYNTKEEAEEARKNGEIKYWNQDA